MTKRMEMSRFHWDRALEKIIDYETCESYYDDECVDILNKLNYQNFHLEKDNAKLNLENMELKKILKKMSNSNGEIWLDNGQIFSLKKMFKGKWVND